MSFLRFCKHLYLTRFSKPASERVLYRALKKNKIRSIVELGVGDLTRTKRLLQFATELNEDRAQDNEGTDTESRIKFTGIDMFEGREDSNGVPLKEAHKTLKPLCQSVKLIPGDPFSALARSANGLQNTDLIIISADHDADALDRAWFYLPRMMHEETLVFMEVLQSDDSELAGQEDADSEAKIAETTLELLSRSDIDEMSRSQDSTARRAA